MFRTIVFFGLVVSALAGESLDPLVNASVGFSMAIQQQLATTRSDPSPIALAAKTIALNGDIASHSFNRAAENTSLLPAEAHTARCTTGTVGSTGAAEENGIVLFPGTGGGTGPKQQ